MFKNQFFITNANFAGNLPIFNLGYFLNPKLIEKENLKICNHFIGQCADSVILEEWITWIKK
jgi:hypothetical protein